MEERLLQAEEGAGQAVRDREGPCTLMGDIRQDHWGHPDRRWDQKHCVLSPAEMHALLSEGSMAGAQALGAGRGLGPCSTWGGRLPGHFLLNRSQAKLQELCPAEGRLSVPTPCPLPAPCSPGGEAQAFLLL